jgi:hypothetical protein
VTIFDLLFLVLFLAAIVTLIAAGLLALRGRWGRAARIARNLVICAAAYIAAVYLATALSPPKVLRVGDSQCSDDWCIAVDSVQRTAHGSRADYNVTLRIFSRARRRPQRENAATDVYLVDAQWRRYDPRPDPSAVPLNTLLQPGEAVATRRSFELPVDARGVGLMVGRNSGFPFCMIVGECEAFHKGTVFRFD